MRTLILVVSLTTFVLFLLPGTPLAADAPSGSVLLFLDNSQGQSALEPQMRLFPILYSLRAHKLIADFEWLPDANAIQVQGAVASAAQSLSSLPGVSRVTPLRADLLDAARQQQRRDQVQVHRRMPASSSLIARPSDAPVFNIHETWNLLQAKGLPAGQAVTAVLKDSGASTKDTLNVNADAEGNIQAGFAADVVQGDSVDITYNATNVTILSDAIAIDFNFSTDHILGTAGANRTVYVNVRDDGIGWCDHHEYSIDGLASAGGAYDVNLTGNYDVIRRTEVDVMSMDGNNNGWTIWRHAPWLLLRTMVNSTNGQGSGLAPDEDVDLVLKTGATVKASQTSHTNSPDSGFGFGFGGADMLPGDTFEATENGNTWASIPIVTLSAQLSGRNITGQAPANKQVVVRTDHYNRATGDWEGSCQNVTADGAGAYHATAPVKLIGNDSVTTFYVDANGFEQQVWDVVPFLQPNKDTFNLRGSFKTSFDGEMDITVTKKNGNLKYQGTGYAFGGWFDQRLAASGKPVILKAEDVVTVKPGAGTLAAEAGGMLTTTVAKINLTLNLANDSVTGKAPKNTHVSLFGQKWWGNGFECRDDCNQNVTVGANGSFNHTFHQDLVAGDYAEIAYTDAKGNVTYKQAFSTQPTITINNFPATFRRGRPNPVTYTIANGVHVDDTFVLADASSRPDWEYTMQNGPEGNWYPGGPGAYDVNVWIAHQGKVYFRAFAHVDGRWIYTKPESTAKAR